MCDHETIYQTQNVIERALYLYQITNDASILRQVIVVSSLDSRLYLLNRCFFLDEGMYDIYGTIEGTHQLEKSTIAFWARIFLTLFNSSSVGDAEKVSCELYNHSIV
jgi:hypothetical protein